MELGNNLDFKKNQAVSMRLENRTSSFPGGADTAGVIYFNSTNNRPQCVDNSGQELPLTGQPQKIILTIDRVGDVIPVGTYGPIRIHGNFTISGVYVDTDVNTSATIDLLIDGVNITSGNTLSISSSNSYSNQSPTWSTSVELGDKLEASVLTNSAASRIVITLILKEV